MANSTFSTVRERLVGSSPTLRKSTLNCVDFEVLPTHVLTNNTSQCLSKRGRPDVFSKTNLSSATVSELLLTDPPTSNCKVRGREPTSTKALGSPPNLADARQEVTSGRKKNIGRLVS